MPISKIRFCSYKTRTNVSVMAECQSQERPVLQPIRQMGQLSPRGGLDHVESNGWGHPQLLCPLHSQCPPSPFAMSPSTGALFNPTGPVRGSKVVRNGLKDHPLLFQLLNLSCTREGSRRCVGVTWMRKPQNPQLGIQFQN